MIQENIIDLNKTRVKVRTKEITSQIKKEDPYILQQATFYKDGKQITTKDIDFKHSCIFICDNDLLAVVSYMGLLNLDNIHIPDTTPTGIYSTIRTTYMTVNSPDIRFSKIEINEGYGYEEIDMPESYKPINFMHKDLILWRLRIDAGLGANEKMYRLCNQWIMDRFSMNKLDWLFFIGTEEQFMETYGNELNLPIYHIISKSGTIPSITNRNEPKAVTKSKDGTHGAHYSM